MSRMSELAIEIQEQDNFDFDYEYDRYCELLEQEQFEQANNQSNQKFETEEN